MLALLGGVLGLLIAVWTTDLLIALAPESIPRLDEVGLDAREVSFSFGFALLTGILFGLLAALQVSSLALPTALKEGGGCRADAQQVRAPATGRSRVSCPARGRD